MMKTEPLWWEQAPPKPSDETLLALRDHYSSMLAAHKEFFHSPDFTVTVTFLDEAPSDGGDGVHHWSGDNMRSIADRMITESSKLTRH